MKYSVSSSDAAIGDPEAHRQQHEVGRVRGGVAAAARRVLGIPGRDPVALGPTRRRPTPPDLALTRSGDDHGAHTPTASPDSRTVPQGPLWIEAHSFTTRGADG